MEERQQNDVNEFNRLYKEMDDLYHDIALKLGLSDSALTIFYAICELGDGCLQKDICSQSFCSKQTINSSIRKLEREGTVYLKRGKGKNMHIYLTVQGREFVVNKVRPAIGMEVQAFLELTPKERGELLRLTGKYLEHFRELERRM